MNRTKTLIKKLKQITLYVAFSWWISFIINIISNKNMIEKTHKTLIENNTKDLFIYTNDNDINDKIETTTMSSNYTIKRYLKSLTFFTIYSRKLYDIILAIKIIIYRIQSIKKRLIICIDNQVSIQTIQLSRINSSQYLIKLIVETINHFRFKNIEIELHWISTHKNISSNELIDVTIKQITK